jgi:hypothetical protein
METELQAMATSAGESAPSEVQIAYNLGADRVYYSSHRGYLYFCDSEQVPVRQTICAVMRGMRLDHEIDAVCLDIHRLFSPAYRVRFSAQQVKPVWAALRLVGVEVITDLARV